MIKVGVVGYSAQKFNYEKAHTILWEQFTNLQVEYGKLVEIVSGLTYMGIPQVAYELADEFGFLTTGIACHKAKDYPWYPVDMIILEGDNWGDQSEKFLNYCDHIIRVGGGYQSHREVQRAIELGKTVEEYKLETI